MIDALHATRDDFAYRKRVALVARGTAETMRKWSVRRLLLLRVDRPRRAFGTRFRRDHVTGAGASVFALAAPAALAFAWRFAGCTAIRCRFAFGLIFAVVRTFMVSVVSVVSVIGLVTVFNRVARAFGARRS